MKKLFQFIILITFTLSMTSCYYDEIYEAELPEGTVVEFSADILPIFNASNCVDCHDGNLDPDLTAGNEYSSLVPDYVNSGDANDSELFTKLSGGHGNVDTASLLLIEAWINSGALNN